MFVATACGRMCRHASLAASVPLRQGLGLRRPRAWR
jgi:hypothetical protein